jgi:hypothetical protein
MDKQKLIKKLDQTWTDLIDSFAGLTDAQMTEPGVTGEWSLKDVLAHVTTWEEEALKALPVILEGGRTPRYSTEYGGIDAFNALKHEENGDRTLPQVLDRLKRTHRKLVKYVENAPEKAFTKENPFLRRLRNDTHGHYPEHTEMIRAWREKE